MIDDTERRILTELQKDGRISNVELADKVGLSESPCLRRVRQLEDADIIKGYTAQLDQKKLGLGVTVFVQVNLDQSTEAMTHNFWEAVRAEPHVVECFAVSGSYDYLLKIVARDLDDFSNIAMRRILKFPGVKDMTSGFVLEEVKGSSQLPL